MFGRLLAKPLAWRNHLIQMEWKKNGTEMFQRLRKMASSEPATIKPGERWIIDNETAHHDWIRLGIAIVVPIAVWRFYLWNYDSTCGYTDADGNYTDNAVTAFIRRRQVAWKQWYWNHTVYHANRNYENMMYHFERKKHIPYPHNLNDYVDVFGEPWQSKVDPELGNRLQYGYSNPSTWGNE